MNYKDITKIIFKNNKLIHWACNKNWYTKNNTVDVYDAILEGTSFLNSYNVSFRERIFYIQNDWDKAQLCPFCKKNKLNYLSNEVRLSKKCKSKECISQFSSINGIKVNNALSESVKIRKIEKCRQAQKAHWANYSDEKKQKIIEKIRLKNTGRKQTQKEIDNRIKSRQNNGRPWHSEETKLKISKSNSITHLSSAFKEKYKDVYKNSHKKISATMKRKIANGEFTPCITNSWTHWDNVIVLENKTKKNFRSSWETVFWLLNRNLNYENIRIPYQYNGEMHSYIVDFEDSKNRVLYEVKPNSNIDNEKNKLKFVAAKSWCIKNNYQFQLITNNWFKDNTYKIDYSYFQSLKSPMKQFLND